MFLFFPVLIFSNILKVGKNEQFKTIKQAVAASKSGDSILVESGVYKEGNLSITHPLSLIGIGRPVLDGEMKYEILSFRANNIMLKARIINSGEAEIKASVRWDFTTAIIQPLKTISSKTIISAFTYSAVTGAWSEIIK